ASSAPAAATSAGIWATASSGKTFSRSSTWETEMADAVLELIEVTKYFRSNWAQRKIRAVENLSFAVRHGEGLGLTGHNGAGHTTTFKVLAGLLRPSAGTLVWRGVPIDWRAPRTGLGFSPEQPYFYDYLTVRETLHLYGRLYGMSRADCRSRIGELV